jgi:hypothetical protein
MKLLKRVLAFAVFAILTFIGPRAYAGVSACSDLSKANPNDLLDLPAVGSVGPESPSVKCTWEGPGPKSEYCGPTPTIIKDEMLGRDRRLLVLRSSESQGLEDGAFVFGCVAGQAKRLLDSSGSWGTLTIEHATADKVILRGSEKPTPGTNEVDRIDFVWDPRIRRYRDNEDNASVIPAPPKQMPCNQLESAKANDLIILANGDFPGDGYGGYPFTHGQGCYESEKVCDWYVEVDDDRMISADRRLISFGSDHRTGTGTWGYLYVFGCVAGQVRTIYGGDFLQGGGVVEPAAPETPTPEETPTPPSEQFSQFSHEVSSSSNGSGFGGGFGFRGSPTATPTSASTSASRHNQRKADAATADTLVVSGCAGYPCGEEVLYTYKWNAALQNYILAAVHYEPN